MVLSSDIPLAARYRPQLADELIGQEKIWKEGTPLWKLVHSDRFHSLLFWGPPGTGKTSLARLIGQILQRHVVELSSVEAGVKDIREAIQDSQSRMRLGDKASILFLDEIHRLNKSQQDSLLPSVESGHIKLIGATTENPSFSVNNALLSRSLTLGFSRVDTPALSRRLLAIAEREKIPVDESLALAIADASDGDVRAALNLLEACFSLVEPGKPLTLEDVRPMLATIVPHFDKKGEYHYDVISAFIKSIRASDPDAAVYYLARMLNGGEDPVFIGRRLVIAASEDIGNASPTALLLAQAALQGVKEIGMPEARILLAQATTYLASSPKSNRSYLSIGDALATVEKTGDLPVPLHLRNAVTKFMKGQDYGKGYVYAHDNPAEAAKISNLPDALKGKKFYNPSQHGSEKAIAELLQRLRP
ncbi:MAG: replication-associated recombination protein A [Chitinophagaceae bacterium]|nr:replication-associated recombination protein A [Oligoflexus sp.]